MIRVNDKVEAYQVCFITENPSKHAAIKIYSHTFSYSLLLLYDLLVHLY